MCIGGDDVKNHSLVFCLTGKGANPKITSGLDSECENGQLIAVAEFGVGCRDYGMTVGLARTDNV